MGTRGARRVMLAALLVAAPALGAELEGVKLEDRVQAGGQTLQLNGIGLRKRAFFKVYVAGLYLPERTGSAAQAMGARGPKRMTLVMLRDVGAGQFAGSLLDGLRDNHSEAELARIKPQVDELLGTIRRIGEAKEGMVIVLEHAPNPGTTMTVNGAPQGEPIAGEELFRALLRIWLGENPVQEDLKKALLGQPG